jgi:glycosyltransferase involved in cell wall biosynthesis
MRIALLCRFYWEEHRRFAANGNGPVQQLAEAVAARGHEVVVLSQAPAIAKMGKSKIGSLEVWLSPRDQKRDFLTGLRDKWAKQTYRHRKVYTDALALRDFLAQNKPFDVLWAQTEEPDGLVAAVAAQIGVRLPPVVTQIQALRYRFEKGIPIFNQKPALRLSFQHSDRILANSDLVAKNLHHYSGPNFSAEKLQSKVEIVYPNLGVQFLKAAQEVQASPDPAADRILFFGALNETKGALVFMEALARTNWAKAHAHFTIIGDFTEKNPEFTARWNSAVAAVRTWLPTERLELLGKVSPFEVMRQVKLARIVVLPSLFDAFSRALVETLSLGRPVITTTGVGAAPLVKEHECGLVVAPADADALAQAMDVALSPTAIYLDNAKKIAQRLLHEFSSDTIAHQLERHFTQVAKHGFFSR